mmetsp:Transcript_59470/g.128611  ORF Transcript_59470/g.128611 Transcript_59470/m.128611 type:complete len:430 (+) Transcript_59470:36-1325(+)
MAPLTSSRCVQKDVFKITDALSVFAAKQDNGDIPLVLVPSHRSPFSGSGWWLTIPTGCYCLLQRFGKDIGRATPGGSVQPPYIRVAYMVTMQQCTYNAPVKECPTADNVRVGVDVVIVFNIRDPQKFVYQLGASHFNMLLSGSVDDGIRQLVRSKSHQSVRTLRGSNAEGMLKLLSDKFLECGVTFSSCIITAVYLPKSLESSLERTTELRKTMEKMRREHESNILEIERKSQMELEELLRRNEQAIVQENGKRKHAELEREQRLVKTSQEKEVALINAGQAAQVAQMSAASSLLRMKNSVMQKRVETISEAEAAAQAKRVQVDINFEAAIMAAEADMQRFIGEAEGVRLDAEAEASASVHFTHKRRHELDIREKEVLKQLAFKGKYNLVGKPGDRLVDALMSGHLDAGPPGSRPGSSGQNRYRNQPVC